MMKWTAIKSFVKIVGKDMLIVSWKLDRLEHLEHGQVTSHEQRIIHKISDE